jgi:hypothetical protein
VWADALTIPKERISFQLRRLKMQAIQQTTGTSTDITASWTSDSTQTNQTENSKQKPSAAACALHPAVNISHLCCPELNLRTVLLAPVTYCHNTFSKIEADMALSAIVPLRFSRPFDRTILSRRQQDRVED